MISIGFLCRQSATVIDTVNQNRHAAEMQKQVIRCLTSLASFAQILKRYQWLKIAEIAQNLEQKIAQYRLLVLGNMLRIAEHERPEGKPPISYCNR